MKNDFDVLILNGPNTRPLVSVLILCYNHEDFIRDALEAIYKQKTTFDYEIIINDDSSTDNSVLVIEDTEKLSVDTTLITHKTNKYSQGLNPSKYPLELVRGEYIAFCEGDDFWTSPDKLQKQVNAIQNHQQMDLCVHPAMQLSLRTGKTSKRFYYGCRERVIPVEKAISRHNQLAPTSSFLARTTAIRELPNWFYNEPDLPVGDFFIEAILGRKGILYLPDVMSVYRREVPGSYTDRFRRASGQGLEDSLERMLYFTEKLRKMGGIPEHSLEQRLSYIRLNYALQFLAIGDRERFSKVSRQIKLKRHHVLQVALGLMRRAPAAFNLGRQSFNYLRKFL